MEELIIKLREFADKRDWNKFHSPKNLIMALTGEVGELNEIYQWLDTEGSKLENLSEKDIEKSKEELADIFLYTLRIADKLNIDLIEESKKKIEINNEKYPVEVSKGNAVKYNRRDE